MAIKSIEDSFIDNRHPAIGQQNILLCVTLAKNKFYCKFQPISIHFELDSGKQLILQEQSIWMAFDGFNQFDQFMKMNCDNSIFLRIIAKS